MNSDDQLSPLLKITPSNTPHKCWEHGCIGRPFRTPQGLAQHKTYEARRIPEARRMSNEELLGLVNKHSPRERRRQAPYAFNKKGEFVSEYAAKLPYPGPRCWDHGCEGRTFLNAHALGVHQSREARHTPDGERKSDEELVELLKCTVHERHRLAPYAFNSKGEFFPAYAKRISYQRHNCLENGCGKQFNSEHGLHAHQSQKHRRTQRAGGMSEDKVFKDGTKITHSGTTQATGLSELKRDTQNYQLGKFSI